MKRNNDRAPEARNLVVGREVPGALARLRAGVCFLNLFRSQFSQTLVGTPGGAEARKRAVDSAPYLVPVRPEGSQPSITPGTSRGNEASSFHKPRRGVIVRTLSIAPCDTPSGLYGRRIAIPRLAPGVIDGFAPFGACRAPVFMVRCPALKDKRLSALNNFKPTFTSARFV